MTVDSFDIAFLSVTLLLPGHIASLVLSTRRARRREATEIEFFRWLALGAVCNAPWLLIIFLFAGDSLRSPDTAWQWAVENREWVAIGWAIAVFLWPVVVGMILAAVQERLVVSPLSGGTAWDSKFIEIQRTDGDWVLVMLTDGNWIAGQFARGSYAAVDPGERDLYLSTVQYTSFDDEFPGLERAGGILIPAESIRLIRFWN